jgi:DNA-directed RNA polymerase specialized sigma24 family protein
LNATDSLDDLVADAASGNEAAWWLLWEQVEPRLERILQNPRVTGRLSGNVDDVRNILVAVMEKLLDKDRRRLKSYLEKKSEKSDKKGGFPAWLAVVAKRVAIDYMRAHEDYVDKRRTRGEDSAAGMWVIPSELPNDSQLFGHRPPVTDRGSALALLRYAYSSLPPEQMAALELWILNKSYGEIATDLELESAEAANRMVRAALERLRRRFRESSSA